MTASCAEDVHAGSANMAEQAKHHRTFIPDLIARFSRLDPTGSGTIAADLFKELFRRIGFTEAVLDVVMVSAGIHDNQVIRYAEFVGWLFGDDTGHPMTPQIISRTGVDADNFEQTAKEAEVRPKLSVDDPKTLLLEASQPEAQAQASSASELRGTYATSQPLEERGGSTTSQRHERLSHEVSKQDMSARQVSFAAEVLLSRESSEQVVGVAASPAEPSNEIDAELELLMYDLVNPYELSKTMSFHSEERPPTMHSQRSLQSLASGCSEFWQDTSASRAGRQERLELDASSVRHKLQSEEADDSDGSAHNTPLTAVTGGRTVATRDRRGNVAEEPAFFTNDLATRDSMTEDLVF